MVVLLFAIDLVTALVSGQPVVFVAPLAQNPSADYPLPRLRLVRHMAVRPGGDRNSCIKRRNGGDSLCLLTDTGLFGVNMVKWKGVKERKAVATANVE